MLPFHFCQMDVKKVSITSRGFLIANKGVFPLSFLNLPLQSFQGVNLRFRKHAHLSRVLHKRSSQGF